MHSCVYNSYILLRTSVYKHAFYTKEYSCEILWRTCSELSFSLCRFQWRNFIRESESFSISTYCYYDLIIFEFLYRKVPQFGLLPCHIFNCSSVGQFIISDTKWFDTMCVFVYLISPILRFDENVLETM